MLPLPYPATSAFMRGPATKGGVMTKELDRAFTRRAFLS
jgi:hypothetical protein